MMLNAEHKIAVLIPVRDEESTIGNVVSQIREHYATADIYVYDNCSSDRSYDVAVDSGAHTVRSYYIGKGNVVRQMFADIEADIYIMIDGDLTYPADAMQGLVAEFYEKKYDLLIGKRRAVSDQAFKAGHTAGNRLVSYLVSLFFGTDGIDVLSGYRVMSRRFVKSLALQSRGFEIETEMTINAIALKIPLGQKEVEYFPRPAGSKSKLRTGRDGVLVLISIFILIRDFFPLHFFSVVALFLFSTFLMLFLPLLLDYYALGTVDRIPTLIMSISFLFLASLSLFSGVLLDAVKRVRIENFIYRYASNKPIESRGK